MLGGWFPPTHIFVGKTTAIMPCNFDITVVITTLGDMEQIETILLVLQHLRWPRQVGGVGWGEWVTHIWQAFFGKNASINANVIADLAYTS